MGRVRSFWVCAWGGLFCALVAASCGGEAFTSGQASGGGAGDSSGATSGDSETGGNAGGSESAISGAPALGGTGNGDAGATGSAAAGASSDGDAGADNGSGGGCAALHGTEFDGHCYVDATVGSVSQKQAAAQCALLATHGQAVSHLLVLDSPEEQEFVLRRFMVSFTDVSDAWLGLTCNELDQPDVNACYCAACSKELLAEKQRAWAWLDGASSTFGWVNANPNAGYRCAALAYNPESTIWGWVDRPCDKTSIAPISGHPHGYRTLCEIEP